MSEIDELIDRIRKNQSRPDDWALLLGEIERLRAERKKMFDLMSSFQAPLHALRMRAIATQGSIDQSIHDVRKAWFEEHGYPDELTRWD